MRRQGTIAAAVLLGLGACRAAAPTAEAQRTPDGFPLPVRPVASIVSPQWSTEPERDESREAGAVMTAAGVAPGMSVADVGAGQGYYTVRLAAKVGPSGRVLAEDIVPAYRDALAARIARERLNNVTVTLGRPDDPALPAGSVDRIFLIHMYHEITSPYALVWHARAALKPGGLIVVVDADRPTQAHGTPPAQLDCEFAAVGMALIRRTVMPEAGGYLALYRASGPAPAPRSIKACAAS